MIDPKQYRRGGRVFRRENMEAVARSRQPKDPLVEAMKDAQVQEGYLDIFRKSVVVLQK